MTGEGERARFVLDTNVVSALRVRGRHPAVEEWASSVPVTDLFVTAMTIGEIERGIVAKERSDRRQGEILREWFDTRVLPAFAGRVLPFDLAAARIVATYRVPDRAPLDDALIAAVAQASGMIIATRNTRHFEPLGVACVDPWTWSSVGG
ncbi:type II toxin-antitoxin system VapC family toxin [Dietzia sp. UBA5065]|uniref:type II toxin-antitoxin system VapC family toxin n=1 Tax=Dietzia sp. UBA5065 TaxID=1946422 RepID=UPI0025BDFEAA|nr:type II toxin-antitoxin system VapC family toxin [Dietzia sp. UBA5065]